MCKLCLKIKISVFLSSFCILPLLSFAQGIDLGTIVVEGDSLGTYRSVESFSLERINTLPSFSLEDVLDYSSSIDLKKNSLFGLLQDVSLRGALFEDTAVTLEGIEINDPQTGHYSMQVPLTSADIEEIEIFKNSQQINFNLKKPKDKGGVLKTTLGEHALWEELVSLNFPLGRINNRVSAEHKKSKGGRQDTDFEVYNFSYHSLWEGNDKDVEFLFGSTKKDFGANSYYSSLYPHQEEHLNQRFFSIRAGSQGVPFQFDNTVYLRRNKDKFLLDRNNPGLCMNHHTTYVYGVKSKLDFDDTWFVVCDIERDKITSTNLNNHHRTRKGVSLGIKDKKMRGFIFNFSGGLDYFEKWRYLENIHLGVGYPLKDTLKLMFHFDRIWRDPSFTELYYLSPANRGDDTLDVQKSNNFEWGIEYSPQERKRVGFSFFLRSQSDTIDWGKNVSTEPWEAENVGDLDTYGVDFYSEAAFEHSFLNKFTLAYTYLELDKESPYTFSKYVFDYNRHKIVSTVGFEHKGIFVHICNTFSKPVERKEYLRCDVKISKAISDFTVSLEGINLFNKDYQKKSGIQSSGRWVKLSVIYAF